ncbi:MAG: carboxylesterase family protein [Desulfarculales bacterium]|nr:carboxylesterase family protein [Desulfarculales bacterium]
MRRFTGILTAGALSAALFLAAPSFSFQAQAAAVAEKPQSQYQQNFVQQKLIQNTSFGKVQGVEKDGALLWEGIPYGKPPVGELRWRAPQDPEPWLGVKETVKENPAIQLTRDGVVGSDDSLNLTVYRPASAEANLPVLYYIHGGNNQTGVSTEFEATDFARKTNSIVVTVNHRLDILGFLNLPALKTGDPLEDSGNYALLDLHKALQWTIDNIANFGGNPNNITISGFSAGGRDVLAILTSPVFKGKFQQAISFSGGLTIADPIASQKVFAAKLAPLAVADKVKSSLREAEAWLLQDNQEVRDYLYSLPSSRLVSALGNGNLRLAAFPHLFADGTVLPSEAFATKNFNSVPLILLASDSEFSMFSPRDPYFAAAQANGWKDEEARKELAFTIKYGSLLYEYANVEDVVKRIGKAYRAPIYALKIAWGTDPALVGEEMARLWGSHHGIFLPLLIEKPRLSSQLYPQAFSSPGVADLSAKLQQYVSNFLWQGDPNDQGLPSWPKWDNKPSELILNAGKDKALISIASPHTSYQEIIKSIQADRSIKEEAKQKIIREILNGRWFSQDLDQAFHTPGLWLQK